jgi:hypothetical protein
MGHITTYVLEINVQTNMHEMHKSYGIIRPVTTDGTEDIMNYRFSLLYISGINILVIIYDLMSYHSVIQLAAQTVLNSVYPYSNSLIYCCSNNLCNMSVSCVEHRSWYAPQVT